MRIDTSKWSGEGAFTQRMIDQGYIIIGNADEVAEQIDDLRSCHGAGGNVEYLAWYCGLQGTVPTEVTVRQLELLATEVMPKLAAQRQPAGS